VKDKELIQLALGLSSPWYVKDIDFNVSKKRMDIYLDFTKGTKFHCPVCNKLYDLHYAKEKICEDTLIFSIMIHKFIQEFPEQSVKGMV
jgi:hypothetical protein